MKQRIHLRRPEPRDQAAFVQAVLGSRSIHYPWVSPPDSPEAFRAYLKRMEGPGHHAFLVCRSDADPDAEVMVGVVNISNVVPEPLCSGFLSYYVFLGHERQGLMREALQEVVRLAFGEMGLHRLEANIQPGNAASIALVRSVGFAREGYSPRYLKVGGRWCDHERWAILAS